MDDKNNALGKLKIAMDEAEQVDMSSVKIGDIIYVPLDEEDGLILKNGYDNRKKYIETHQKLLTDEFTGRSV